ncbi:MAG: CrcB family protein [Propionibacteriaceae bacterium]|jgi:CrcB protein|nr:CrcB family protein [Propionibacteriaceae bacterium]
MIWIALAGGCGALARYATDTLLTRKSNRMRGWATWIINVLGSFLIGVLVGWFSAHNGDAELRIIIGSGFLGGYTTFSTACVESARLLRKGEFSTALLLSASMLVTSTLATALGLVLGGLG